MAPGLALLAACALLHPPQAKGAPRQTEWQRALVGRVRERARRLSDEATPALLRRLDSTALRADLAECCPSTLGLTAQQLLERLQAEVAVVEVASGFPATRQPLWWPDAPGMSVEDGLNGSFFQNVWQRVLLEATDPGAVFHKATYDHIAVSCDDARGTVDFQYWAKPGGHGRLISNATYPLHKCIHDRKNEVLYRYTCNATSAVMDVWLDSHDAWVVHKLRKTAMWRSRGSFEDLTSSQATEVTCPTKEPVIFSQAYSADGECHEYVNQNFSEAWLTEDDAEQHSYGLKPFASSGNPSSLLEASERGPYALVNYFLLDEGSPLYGDVSAVFSLRAMREVALLSAVDTGYYQSMCADSTSNWDWGDSNCSAYAPLVQLGTMDHLNHLFLINEGFWFDESVLAVRFARMEGQWGTGKIPARHLLKYWEALPAASLQYPEDVRFLLASFPSLFGTSVGTQLQQWAKQRGWLLVWSLGFNLQDVGVVMDFSVLGGDFNFSANQRLVDPLVALETTATANLSLTSAATRTFQDYWGQAAAMGNYSPDGRTRGSNATWASLWSRLAGSLPSSLRLRPLRGGDCPRPPSDPECIGVSHDSQCVCYEKEASDAVVHV